MISPETKAAVTLRDVFGANGLVGTVACSTGETVTDEVPSGRTGASSVIWTDKLAAVASATCAASAGSADTAVSVTMTLPLFTDASTLPARARAVVFSPSSSMTGSSTVEVAANWA